MKAQVVCLGGGKWHLFIDGKRACKWWTMVKN